MSLMGTGNLTSSNLDLTGRVIGGTICLALLMQLVGVFRLPINWDEFYNLSLVYNFAQGEIDNRYQTLILRTFQWVLALPIGEINQIIAGRLFMYVCGVCTCVFIYLTARRFVSAQAALYGVLAYLSYYFIIVHLTSMRVDGVATTLLMAVLWLVTDPSQSIVKTIVAGLMIGLAGVFTFKSIFYMPIVAVFLLSRWKASDWSRRDFSYGLVMGATALISFFAIYAIHSAGIEVEPTESRYVGHVLENSFVTDGLAHNGKRLALAIIFNPLFWVMIGVGVWDVLFRIRSNDRAEKVMSFRQLSFAFPLTTLIFYAHVAPYYYIFVLAPTSILVAIAAERLMAKPGTLRTGAILYATILTMLLGAWLGLSRSQIYQRQILSNVHQIFEMPVSYLDYCGMVPSFNRIKEPGLFINPDSLDHQAFLDSGPVMRDILRKHQPEFFIANITALDLDKQFQHPLGLDFLPEDVAVMRDNFVQFWGPIYVPGKRLVADGARAHQFEILIDGEYTLTGSEAVTIDGARVEPNGTVQLSQGIHIATDLMSSDAALVWGDNLEKPAQPPVSDRLFPTF